MEEFKEQDVFPKVLEPISYGKGLPGNDAFLDHDHDGINSKLLHPQSLMNIGIGAKTATFVIGPVTNADSDTYDYVTDGIADDVEINAAITALPTNGGRIIFREGTYTLAATITIAHNGVTLQGQGAGSIIKLGTVVAVHMFTLGHASTQFQDCTIRDLYLDGNTSQVTGDSNIINNTASVPLENLTIQNCTIARADDVTIKHNITTLRLLNNYFLDIDIIGSDTHAIVVSDNSDSYILIEGNSFFLTGTDTGLILANTLGNVVVDNNSIYIPDVYDSTLISGCNVVSNNWIGHLNSSETVGNDFIGIDTCKIVQGNTIDPSSDDAGTVGSIGIYNCERVSNNRVFHVGTAIKLDGNVGTWIVNNNVDAREDGIYINSGSGSPCTVISNNVTAGDEADNTYSGIRLNTPNCMVAFNNINETPGSEDLQYGIRSAGENIIMGNIVEDGQTAFILFTETDEVSHNIVG